MTSPKSWSASSHKYSVYYTHKKASLLRPLHTGRNFFVRLIRTSIYFFELLFVLWVLSHRTRILRGEKATWFFFGPGSIFLKFRFRQEHVWPIKTNVVDNVTVKTFNMADRLIVFVSQNPVLFDKSHKNYRDNDLKDNVWRVIANDLQYDDGVYQVSTVFEKVLLKLPTMLM